MSNEKINSNFTVEDIHDYLSDKMTPAEMNAIEKAALDDPLLAEAIEGYAAVPEFTQPNGYDNMNEHLIELKAKFMEPGAKVISIKKYDPVWRVAAAVLLLIGSFAAFKYFTNTSSEKPPVTIAKVEPEKPAATNTLPVADSIKTFKPEVQAVLPGTFTINQKPIGTSTTINSTYYSLDVTDDEDVKTQPTISAGSGAVVINDSLNTGSSIAANAEVLAPVISPEKETNVSSAWANRKQDNKAKKATQNNINTKIVFSGRVVDRNNNPIPFASIKTEEGLMSTTDNRGTFSLPITRKNPGKVTFRGNNFLQKTVTPTNGFDVIVLENNRVSNSRNYSNNNIANVQAAPAQVSVLYKTGAEPKEGWAQYIQFLVSKLSYSEYDNGKPVVGETIVKFEVDPFGLPTNFSFEKQIDTDVNDALEDLIVTGPEWKVIEKGVLPRTIILKITF